MKRNARKGFTLIEIIIVLVILAIIAAASIPTMMGFIQDARAKTLVTEARATYVAASSIFSEYVASNSATPQQVKDGLDLGGRTSAATAITGTTAEDRIAKRLIGMMSPDIVFGVPAQTNTLASAVFSIKETASGSGVWLLEGVTYTKYVGGKPVTITLNPPAAAEVVFN